MIRLGDGEGRVMGYPHKVDKKDLDFSLKRWFGHTEFDGKLLLSFSSQLKTAVSRADIVGVPRLQQQNAIKAYRYVVEIMDESGLVSSGQIVTDAAIHRYLQFGLYYRDILADLDFLGLINGHDIGGLIKKTFSISKVMYYSVPTAAEFSDKPVAEHYPARFDELREILEVPYKGAVFLVGAGPLGKIYCQWIKELGGIALDIGAIFDSWAGIGRLQHPAHRIEHYRELPHLSPVDASKRFNRYCDEFNLDTERLAIDDLNYK